MFPKKNTKKSNDQQDLSTMQYIRFTFAYKNLLKHLNNKRISELFKITEKEYKKRFPL